MTNAIALMAVREVAKQVYAKYFHGMAVSTIQRKVEKVRITFSIGRMR